VSSVTRAGDDDDDDDEVRIINGRHEFVEADSGLVPDLLAADADFHSHDCTAPPWRSFLLTKSYLILSYYVSGP